jgi:predicted alpha/beta hydrolase family esterase
MVARLQQLIAISLFAAAAIWATYFLVHGPASWAAAGVAAVVVGYAGALGLEFWLLDRSYSAQDPLRPAKTELYRAWWAELLATPPVFLWRQPFRSNAIADLLAPAKAGGRGVLLVHGFFCNRGVWNPWLRRLREAQVPFAAPTLEPVFGSIDNYAAKIDEAVTRLEAVTGHAPVVVAHSMGGLAVRAWRQAYAGSSRCGRVVTIGTPHGGTAMARLAHGTNAGQMRTGSPWLQALARAESVRANESFVCFWSHCDNVVFPTESATLLGADNRRLDSTPHVRMVYHPEVFAEVMRLVRAP